MTPCMKWPAMKPATARPSRVCWSGTLGSKKIKRFRGFSQIGRVLFSWLFRHKRLCFCCVTHPSCDKKRAFSPKCCVSKMLCHFCASILSSRIIENNSISGSCLIHNQKKSERRMKHSNNNFRSISYSLEISIEKIDFFSSRPKTLYYAPISNTL